MTRVLVITHDVVGSRMAGPAIRAFELARQISRVAEVTLTSLMPLDGNLQAGFPIVSFEDDADRLDALARQADVLVLQGLMHRRYPMLLNLGKRLVMDLYDPYIFESYPQFMSQSDGGQDLYRHFWDVQNEQMDRADFSICASERQRDMFLGRYCALGRLGPDGFREDPSFRRLIDVVPFGVPDLPVSSTRKVLKGVMPGIGPDDRVIIWGGGVWNWFDPITVLRAMKRLSERRHDLKLVFMGVKHPNPEIPEMEMTRRAMALSDELGLTGQHVFFNHGWVPYHDRQNYLAEADLGISSHFDAIETRFSFRTRVLDYFWAGLPVLTTEGDSMAEIVQRERLGRVVRYESVDDWVEGIESILGDPVEFARTRERVQTLAETFRWSRAASPIVTYCRDPWTSAPPTWSVSGAYGKRRLPQALQLVVTAARTLRYGGVTLMAAKGQRFVSRRIARISRRIRGE